MVQLMDYVINNHLIYQNKAISQSMVYLLQLYPYPVLQFSQWRIPIISMQTQQNHKRYHDLLVPVGDYHCYQYILMILTYTSFCIFNTVVSSLPYLFMNPQFDCQAMGIQTSDCESYICQNFKESEYGTLPVKENYFTIAIEFGPYYCDDNAKLGFYRSTQSIGSMIGVIVGVIMADNFNRLFVLKAGVILAGIGSLLLFLSNSIVLVCGSLILIGAGIHICFKMFQVMVSEQCEEHLMKKFISISLLTYIIAQIWIGPIFKTLNSWRNFTLLCFVIPNLMLLILVFIIVEDSPKFLLKKGQAKAIQALNKIAKINCIDFRYEEGDLEQYIKYNIVQQQSNQVYTPYDLVRYRSLRRSTITLSIGYFSVNIFYYGLSSTIDKIGFNPVLNSVLLGIGSLIGVPISFLIATIVLRRQFGMFYNAFCGICCLAIYFLTVPASCEVCTENTIQMILLILMRIATVVQNQIFYLHLIEAFPLSIRSIGLGTTSILGDIGIFCSQFIIVAAFEVSIKFPFLILTICSFFFMVNYYLAPETLNESLKDQIDQILQQNQRKAQANQSSQKDE